MSATLLVGAAGALHAVGGTTAEKDSATLGASIGASSGIDQAQSQASRSNGRGEAATHAPSPDVESAGGNGVVAPGTGTSDGRLPGVGPSMSAQIPADALQLVLVSGEATSSSSNVVTLWERASPEAPWTRFGSTLLGHNGENGWTAAHREGDLASPVGVYSLTAAGGRLADPGTGLPYEYRPSFYRASGGPAMEGAFDYVVAIDYNRLPGHPPSDPTRPLGEAAGGDIWLHVDHSSPTQGCVSVPQDGMGAILRWLTPSSHPMIVMGDRATLAA